MFDSIVAFDNHSVCLLILKLCAHLCVRVCFFIILSLITVSSGVRAWIKFDKHIHYIINKHSLHIHTTTDDGQIRSENEKAITIVVETELL